MVPGGDGSLSDRDGRDAVRGMFLSWYSLRLGGGPT